MPEQPDDRPRLINQTPEGKFLLSVFEQADKDGGSKRFWTLTRDVPPGEKPLIIGGTMEELPQARDLIARAERFIPRGPDREVAPAREPGPNPRWLAVVHFEELKEGGAAARVFQTYPEHERHKAQDFTARHSEYVLLPHAFDERPQDRDRVFVPAGMSKETDRHIAELEWQASNGKYFTWGVWYERESGPREGQLVTVGVGREPIRGDAEARKITPVGRPIEPGDPDNPTYVVIQLDEKVFGRGRVVAIHHEESKAVEQAKHLEQDHRFRERVLGPEWNTMTFGGR
jgi:hypothetical protein